MTSVPPWHRAIVLSTLDLPDGQDLLVYSCEDCACAVSERHGPGNRGQRSHVDIGSQEPWVNSTETAEIQLPRGYRLLFNPLGCGGAVVVNEPAHGIYRSFDRPVSLRDVRS